MNTPDELKKAIFCDLDQTNYLDSNLDFTSIGQDCTNQHTKKTQ